MPPGLIEDQDGVCAEGDSAANLIKMHLHGLGVGVGQRQCRTGTTCRTNRAEQTGAAWTCTGFAPVA